ncbi:MAG: hypothetical protein KBD00_04365 [Candidatus Peribacteraceae bacterium]|nr:hypothetical protein [Candidatus Peribacteraceae bacterium]
MTNAANQVHAIAVPEATTLGVTTFDDVTIIHILLHADHSEDSLDAMENELSRVVRKATLVRANTIFLLSFHATDSISELMVSVLLRIGEEIKLFGGKLHMCLPDVKMDEAARIGLQDFVLPGAGGCIASACALCTKYTPKNKD